MKPALAGDRTWQAGECSLQTLLHNHSRSTHADGAFFGATRYYAIVVTADRHELNELLVSNGLARIYGTRTPLPDGRDSREYLAHLRALEDEAKAAKRGGWGMLTSASPRRAK
jgi:hypothetical protein